MSNYKKVFIICPVRLAYNEVKYELEQFTSFLEKEGFEVHLPHRDTKQNDTGINICIKNSTEIRQSDIVIVVFEKSSKGIYFDMGSAFSENKMIIGFCISDVLYENKKSFEKMLLQ